MFKYPSISRNLTLGLGLAILLVGFSSMGIYYSVQMDMGKKRLEKLRKEYSEVIGNALRFSLWNMSAESVTLTSSAYSRNELIVFLSVKSSVGTSMFLYENSGLVQTAQKFTANIVYEGIFVGTIELALTDYFIKEQNRKVLISGISMILLSFFCLILMTSFLLRRFLKDPVTHLRRISSEYSNGNYDIDISSPKYVEFRDLIQALTDMGKRIQSQIARRKQAEEQLKEHRDQLEEKVVQRTTELKINQQRMEAILKASPVGIGLVVNRRLNWANDTMYQMVGYGEDSLLGQESHVLYKDYSEYERVGKILYSSIIKKGYGSIDTQWVRKDGTVFDCNIRSCILENDDSSIKHIVAVSDISEGKLLEEKLQRAEKMEAVGALAGGVAHDLNNILSGIVSYPELLLMNTPPDSPLRKPLMTIQRSGEKAVNIVQDLLTMARRGVSVNEVVSLNQIISEQLDSPEMAKLVSFHPGVKITSDFTNDLLNVNGSPTHLSKSIMNLLSNGAESMPDGGEMSISTSNIYLDTVVKGYEQIAEGDYVKIVVSDTGIGISEEDIIKIFDPFYTKKSMGRSGTGLGMAVVWGTIKDHNGYIDIDSTEGVGTVLTMYLPVTRRELKDKAVEVSLDEYRGHGESILVIDDVEEQREIATSMLENLGYQVYSVPSGEEAVEYLRENSVNLIVLDMIMDPGVDGLDTYKQILEIHPQQKAVIASGFSRTERVNEMKKLGAGRYIKKPYTLRNIGAAVKKELQSKR